MTINWLDWFGYAASVVILVSLTMTSIVRLRWTNLAGDRRQTGVFAKAL
ncbi:MAG: hypothetical protein KAU31_01090 [Spirochaetaceae bacterium]|nr:hypothetical protein [Spirochaetaceae bacterium]